MQREWLAMVVAEGTATLTMSPRRSAQRAASVDDADDDDDDAGDAPDDANDAPDDANDAPDDAGELPCPACGTAAPLVDGACSDCGLQLE